ncbi:hypothetical protein D3C80_1067760 [compost metagenome]
MHLRQRQKSCTPKVLQKMNNNSTTNRILPGFTEPMWQIRPQEEYISLLIIANIITNKRCSITFCDHNQLALGMPMPSSFKSGRSVRSTGERILFFDMYFLDQCFHNKLLLANTYAI